MKTFETALNDVSAISSALRQLEPRESYRDALVELYAAGSQGIAIDRDSRNRLHGRTIYHLSRTGSALTRALGTGPRDGVMWFGTTKMRGRAEYWVMRPQIRAVLEELRWVDHELLSPDQHEEQEVASECEYEGSEGNLRLIAHMKRERDPRIREVKRRASRLADGSFECEACGANSGQAFPGLDALNWEVHHRAALAETGSDTRTRLTDLAILCPTCHRAIHCVIPMPSVERFRLMFFSGQAQPR